MTISGVTLGLALLIVVVTVRAAVRNRHVRGRLFASGLVVGLYTLAAAAHTYGGASPAFRSQLEGVLAVSPLDKRNASVSEDLVVVGTGRPIRLGRCHQNFEGPVGARRPRDDPRT